MPEDLDGDTYTQLKDLQLRGRYLDAWNLVKELPPPEQWSTPTRRLRGARLIEKLGARDWHRRIVFAEWRKPASRAEARGDVFWEVLSRRSPFLSWQWLLKNAPAANEEPERHLDHQAHLAIVLVKLRDFEAAEKALDQAQQHDESSVWVKLLRASILEDQDRREAALAVAQAVLATDPTYISAICTTADLLAGLRRDAEAIQVLIDATLTVQSARVAETLARLHTELGAYDEAWQALDLYEQWSPLLQGKNYNWLFGMRCDICSHRGDLAGARHWAEKVDAGFYRRVAAKLQAASGRELRRKVLPVPFIQQNHSTCAPASMTSIAHYWGHDMAHQDVANEICYDGTPDHKERSWAEAHGWVTREFRVTVEAAELLLDEDMPFIVNTFHPGGGHAQVVMGYDQYRTVLFIRDPGNRHASEFLAAEVLEEQEPFGPRGFVMVPPTEGSRLAELQLPDADIYDQTHKISTALDRHERALALSIIEVLRRDFEGHRLRWHAELALSRYDGNHSQILAALEELLRSHPNVLNWQTERLHMIREIHGRTAMVAALREACQSKDSHPILWRMLAREIHWNHQHAAEASRLLMRVHRQRHDELALLTAANLLWEQQQRELATQIYRFAACVDDKDEALAMTYFRAARWIGKTEVALTMLRNRFAAQAAGSAQPAVTLFQALKDLNLVREGFEVLEESLLRRPDDADHTLFVAGELLLWNKIDRARALLDKVGEAGRAAAWHRVRARLAKHEGDGGEQLRQWQAVLKDQPLDVDAHRAVAWLLELQEGQKSALAYLDSACQRFPFHWQLHVALVDWSRDQGAEKWAAAVQHLLRIDPSDGWARREMADALRASKNFSEAHEQLAIAANLDPDVAPLHSVRCSVLEDEGRLEEARKEARSALKFDVDNSFAMYALVRLSRTPEERMDALRYIQAELKEQITQGGGILDFYKVAQPYLTDAELERVLREAWQARPDLWQTGVKLAEHLRSTGQLSEAVELLRGLTDKFPLMPRAWMELSLSLEAGGDRQAAIVAASHIPDLNPGWEWGMRTLSELKRKSGDFLGAREVIEQALRYSPRDAYHHGWLAEVLWNLNEKEAAIASLARSVEIEPDYGWAWSKLDEWGTAVGMPNAAREAALKLQQERPAEARTWIIYADLLTEPHELEECLRALDRAIALEPQAWRAPEKKAHVLGMAGRYREALQVCRNNPSGGTELRLREAWVLHRKGAVGEAIEVMSTALQDDPNHVWGWQRLSDWYRETNQHEKAEQACVQGIRLQPGEAIPLGYLAQLQLTQGKVEEAQQTLQKALQIDPGYHYGFATLFGIFVKGGNWQRARELVDSVAPHFSPAEKLLRLFMLHARQGQWPDAREWLAALIADPDDDRHLFEKVLEEMESCPRQEIGHASQQIAGRLRSDPTKVNVNAGWLYVELIRLRGGLPMTQVLNLLPPESEIAARAYERYIYWLGDFWQNNRQSPMNGYGLAARIRLDRLLRQQREWLFRIPDLHGAVTYALNRMKRFHDTAEWLADWRERPALELFVLNNLILSLQALNRPQDERQVLEFALKHPTHNALKQRFHIRAALEAAVTEDREQVAALMERVNPQELDDYGAELNNFLDLLLPYLDDQKVPPPFKDVQARLDTFMKSKRTNPVMLDTVERACALIARRLKSRQPRIWFRLRRLGLKWFSH